MGDESGHEWYFSPVRAMVFEKRTIDGGLIKKLAGTPRKMIVRLATHCEIQIRSEELQKGGERSGESHSNMGTNTDS